MKKRIALLLVFVLILSLVPLNILGASRLEVTGGEDISLPANVVDTLSIDLAELDTAVNTGGGITDGAAAGYPISISLTGDAVFGVDLDLDTYGFDYEEEDFSSDDPLITYGNGAFESVLQFVNEEKGIWEDGSPDQTFTVESEPEPTASPTATPTASPTATPTATPTASPTATPTASPTATPTASPTATPTASPTATPTNPPIVSSAGLVALNIQPAPYVFSATYEYEVQDDNQIDIIFKTYDESGNPIGIPANLPEGEALMEIALPIVLGADGWDAELELEDLSGGDVTFDGFPAALVSAEPPADKTPEEVVDDLLGDDGEITPDEITGALDSLGLSDLTGNTNNAEDILSGTTEAKLSDFEEEYINTAGISPAGIVPDANVHANFADAGKISVVGAALSAKPGETVSLHFAPPASSELDFDEGRYTDAVLVDITLRKDNGDAVDLISPIIITVPVPEGIDPDNFRILHFHGSGDPDVIIPKNNGDGTCSFVVSGFSVFAFVNVETVTPGGDDDDDDDNNSSGSRRRDRDRDRRRDRNDNTPSSSAAAAAPVLTPNWQVVLAADSTSQITAQVNVPTALDAFNSYRASIGIGMIQSAIQQASVHINSMRAADPTASLFVEVNISAADSAAAADASTYVVIDTWALQGLNAAGLGLVVNTPTSYFMLDAAAINALNVLEKPAFNFVAKPAAFQSLAARQAANGNPVYEVTLKDLFGRNISNLPAGSAVFGIMYQPSAAESSGTLSAARIEGGTAAAIAESSYEDGWLSWADEINELFTVTN